MKTIKFLAALVAAFTISINASANNSTSMVNMKSQPTMSTLYKYNNVGDHKYMTVYNTDDMGRVTSKIIYIKGIDTWIPVAAYSVYYGEEENIVTYAGWNNDSKAFNQNASQQHFNAQEYPVVIALPEVK